MKTPNTKNLLLFMLPVLLAAILFWPVLSFELVWDDSEWPERLDNLHGSWGEWLQHVLTTATLGSYYRPLAFASFYWPFDTPPTAFWHMSSYCLFLANLVILGLIFYSLQKKMARRSAASHTTGVFSGLSLLLFMALHPTQVETVAWVSCRFDLMSSLFLLLLILTSLANLARWQRYSAQTLLFFLALLSKETAIVFLGIYPVLMYLVDNDDKAGFLASLKQQSVTLGLMLAAAACYAMLWYQNAYSSGFSQRLALNPLYTDPYSHLLLILATLGYTLRMLVYPFIRLSPVHHQEGNISLADPYLWLGIAMIAFACHAWLTRKQYLPVIAIFLMGIFPFLNWKQLSFMGDIFQNRYLYLPIQVGVIALYACLLHNPLPEYLSRYRITIPLYLAGMGFVAFSITPLWKNDLTLWSWVVAENPRSAEARNNLANALLSYNHIDAAQEQIEASLVIRDNFHAYVNLAHIFWIKGDHEKSNHMALIAMQHGAYSHDRQKLILMMAHRNLSSGNIGKARWWLKSIPAEQVGNAAYQEEYKSLQAQLHTAEADIKP